MEDNDLQLPMHSISNHTFNGNKSNILILYYPANRNGVHINKSIINFNRSWFSVVLKHKFLVQISRALNKNKLYLGKKFTSSFNFFKWVNYSHWINFYFSSFISFGNEQNEIFVYFSFFFFYLCAINFCKIYPQCEFYNNKIYLLICDVLYNMWYVYFYIMYVSYKYRKIWN